jgi:imidazoleglycerol-phosphate dehydratase
MTLRSVQLQRKTFETDIALNLQLDGVGAAAIQTGIGFLDHMLTALTKHTRFDLTLQCQGDLFVDDHHTAEDTAIVLGQAFAQALGDKRGIRRFGSAYAPLDEALARAVVDISGRPWAEIHLGFVREKIGEIACENLTHWFQSFALQAKISLHVDILRGANDHHKAEAAFKALALALRQAVAFDQHTDIPSTKGLLAS